MWWMEVVGTLGREMHQWKKRKKKEKKEKHEEGFKKEKRKKKKTGSKNSFLFTWKPPGWDREERRPRWERGRKDGWWEESEYDEERREEEVVGSDGGGEKEEEKEDVRGDSFEYCWKLWQYFALLRLEHLQQVFKRLFCLNRSEWSLCAGAWANTRWNSFTSGRRSCRRCWGRILPPRN